MIATALLAWADAAPAAPADLLAARVLMAFTLAYHIIYACLGVGLPVLLLFAEWRFLRTRSAAWLALARRWSKTFAVLFAIGAVSGTVLSFELGLLWPELMGTFGAVIGMPFTLEAFAFFLEAIFIGIYLYGWDRLPARVHFLTGIPIAVAGLASAWFVVTANAWMNAPQGFTMSNGQVVDADPLTAMLNPATGAQTTHMIVAAYMVTGFLVASCYAAAQLRQGTSRYFQRGMLTGLALGLGLAPIQVVVGDWAAVVVARTQPVKLAAMEGQFETQSKAPLRIGGIPDAKARRTRYAVEIPGGLSWLAYRDASAVVVGLNDFPPDETPPVVIVHLAFQLMVGTGLFLTALSAYCGWLLWRRRPLPRSRAFLWVVLLTGPLSVMAMEAGWVVTEVGRQPWVVQGVMRTADAVTHAPGVKWILATAVVVYTGLTVGAAVVLRRLAAAPGIVENGHGA